MLFGRVYNSVEIAEITGFSQRQTRRKISNAIEDGTLTEKQYMQAGQSYVVTNHGIKKVFGKYPDEFEAEKVKK